MKKIFLINLILLSCFAYGADISDLTSPKPFLGRMANSDKVESKTIKKQEENLEKKAEISPNKEQNQTIEEQSENSIN